MAFCNAERAPWLHRWQGRVYSLCSVLAGVAGMVYLSVQEPVGGPNMRVAFFLYGAWYAVTAFKTWRLARAKDWNGHARWVSFPPSPPFPPAPPQHNAKFHRIRLNRLNSLYLTAQTTVVGMFSKFVVEPQQHPGSC